MEKTFYLELKAEVLFKIPVQAETFSQAYEKIKNVQYNTLADLSQGTVSKVLKTQKGRYTRCTTKNMQVKLQFTIKRRN